MKKTIIIIGIGTAVIAVAIIAMLFLTGIIGGNGGNGGDDDTLRADMNDDGVVDNDDATYLACHLTTNPDCAVLHGDGDVNCDGNVNVADVAYLTQYLLENPDYMPLYPTC